MNVQIKNKEIEFSVSMTHEELANFNTGVNYFLGKALKEDCSKEEITAITNISQFKDAFVLAMNS